MNRLIPFLAVAFFTPALFAPLQADTITVGADTRTFVLYAPTGLTNPPLVINMHGMGGTGSQQRSYTRMDRIADREKFVVAYPDGLENSWDISGSRDVDFILALIDTLHARIGIDLTRVYATGFSMGGFMSHRLGCVIPDRIAAIAPVAGLAGYSRNCSTARPLPVLQIHGTADSSVKYSGVAATISGWVTRNGCPAAAVVTRPYPDTNQNSVAWKEYYGPCKAGSEVILLSLEGVGHAWPSNTTTQINASEEIWAFFKNHSLGGAGVAASVTGRVRQCRVSAVYDRGVFLLEGIRKLRSASVVDLRGTTLHRFVSSQCAVRTSTSYAIPFAGLPEGVYCILMETGNGRMTARVAVR